MRNIVFTLGCGFVAFLAGVLVYFYNKPRNLTAETGIAVTAADLYTQYTSDQLQANAVYLNKVLQVSGHVLTVKYSHYAGPVVILNTGDPMGGIACSLNKTATTTLSLKPGEKITIKGACAGYLTDVKIMNSQLSN